MGTRGLIGLVVDDKVYATYNHYDSYPSYLGENGIRPFAAWLANEANVTWVRDAVTRLTIVDDQDKPTPEQAEKLKAFTDAGVSTGDDFYSALRGAQGNLAAYLTAGFWPDSLSFASDSLFCEHAYLVNLDKSVVEYYRGFVKGAAKGRFADAGTRGDYGPITLVAEVPFAVAALEGFWSSVEAALGDEGDDDAEVQRLVSVAAGAFTSGVSSVPQPAERVTTTTRVVRRSRSWTIGFE